MEDELDFSDLAPKRIRVIGPDKLKYFLITASVEATIKFRSASAKAGRFENVTGPDGKEHFKVVGFNEVAEQELVLVANTLARSEGDVGEQLLLDRSGNPVLIEPVKLKRWHGGTIAKLYEASLKLSPWLQKGDESGDEVPLPKDSSADMADSSKPQTI
jgi:hypothetical protein